MVGKKLRGGEFGGEFWRSDNQSTLGGHHWGGHQRRSPGQGLLGPAWYNIHLQYGSLNTVTDTDDLTGLYTEKFLMKTEKGLISMSHVTKAFQVFVPKVRTGNT